MNDPLFAQLFRGMGFPQQRLEGSLGTGVMFDSAGLAVTNAHVIRGAEEITIALSDGREFQQKSFYKMMRLTSHYCVSMPKAKNSRRTLTIE